jgi:hypothetical protein
MGTDFRDAWASRGNNRLCAEKFKRRIFADMERMCGKTDARERKPAAAGALQRYRGSNPDGFRHFDNSMAFGGSVADVELIGSSNSGLCAINFKSMDICLTKAVE